jgi:lysozyme family protein
MSFLDNALDAIIAREGGYVNDPADRGGETRYGITVAVARQSGYDGPMKDLPLDLAKNIYADQYWRRPGFSRVSQVSERLAERMLDCGINMGPSVSTGFLQRALNALSQNGELYEMLTRDGAYGDRTHSALRAYIRARGRSGGEQVLITAFNGLQTQRYIELTEGRPQNARFTFGWLRHRIWL